MASSVGIKYNWRDPMLGVRVDLGEWSSEHMIIFTVEKKEQIRGY